MSAGGVNHVLLGRPMRLDRQGILAVLRSFATDRRAMLDLRRLLAEELSRSSIHQMRDETVIELLAERYLRGTLRLVEVRPPEPKLEGFTVEGAEATPLQGPTNEAGDLKPSPIVPPEYPMLARFEADNIIDATLKLINKIGELLFSTFGWDKRISTIAEQYRSTSEEEGQGISRAHNAVDAALGIQIHAGGAFSRPLANVPDAYNDAARMSINAPPQLVTTLVTSLEALATVPRQNKRSPDDPTPEKGPKFSELKWSVDRVEVGQDVEVTFGYSGLEPGRAATVTFFECNADGSRKRIAQEMVQVDAESGEGKIAWKRDPERAKADLAEDQAEGDTGPVEYRFTVEARGSGPSDESGPLWLTNTVTINLGGGDDAQDKPSVVVVLSDHEKEIRVLAKDGKATFEKVLVGPLKVRIENPAISGLTWSEAKAEAGEAVEASFSYEKAMAGVKVEVHVQDGTGRVVKEVQATLDSESGQAKISFTRSEDEAAEDMDLIERDEDAGPVEYRFVVVTGGGESEPSPPLRFTHKVVLPVSDFNEGEALPDDMEPVLVDAEGTEHRGEISGEEASFEGVVYGPTTLKIEPKRT